MDRLEGQPVTIGGPKLELLFFHFYPRRVVLNESREPVRILDGAVRAGEVACRQEEKLQRCEALLPINHLARFY